MDRHDPNDCDVCFAAADRRPPHVHSFVRVANPAPAAGVDRFGPWVATLRRCGCGATTTGRRYPDLLGDLFGTAAGYAVPAKKPA